MKNINQKLARATVGIAGAGGLGSNAAACLVRSGIGKIIIADFDIVEHSNLNRQFYFADQIGQAKVDAIEENLLRIREDVEIDAFQVRIDSENAPDIFQGIDILLECLDSAEAKAMLVGTALAKMNNIYVISASGMAGFGRSNEIVTRKISERLILVGDLASDMNNMPMTAARVAIAASHQANACVEILMDILR